ncbi:MAG TPA: transglutaminase-like domain-containing protein [Frankiaceae bacterium]|nr:transglutaminase-like domain-containing protein [Frankiaceae bacterium]
MTAESRRRFAETMRAPEPDLGLACLLIGAEISPDLVVEDGLAELDLLAEAAAPYVLSGEEASGLRRVLADDHGFRGYGDDYGDLRASLLHEVLRRRRGLPILLSVVYLEVARRLSVPAYGIGLPGHFVAEVAGQLVDPFYGGRLVTRTELARRVGPVGDGDFEPWPAHSIVTRVLGNIRAASTRHDRLRTRLWAVELSMLIPSHSLLLRRERGEILVSLGDYLAGAFELEAYADAVASVDPEAADHALRAARMSRARLS